jgi:hypothetical protein
MRQFVETSVVDPLIEMWGSTVRGLKDEPSRAEREIKIHECKQQMDEATQMMFRQLCQFVPQDVDYVREGLGL